MPSRAIWRGVISFGMVSIPVRIFTATRSNDLHFNQLHREDKVRLRQKRWCPQHDAEVAPDEIVRGYEFAKGQYVILEEDDFDDLPVPSRHAIDLSGFIAADEIDPVYHEKTYYIEPEETGVKPFALLIRALKAKGLVAVGKLALRNKESLCILRAAGDWLLLTTLFYAEEVKVEPEIDLSGVEIGDDELDIALKLIDLLTASFDPKQYKDAYRAALLERVAAKVEGQETVEAWNPPAPAEAVDLIAALKASIEAAERDAHATAAAPAKPKAAANAKKGARKRKAAAKT